MRCLVCDSNDWRNVDEFRLKPADMHICNNCGFVSYPKKWQTEDEIKKHYEDDYRKRPTSGNLFAGERKNHFHNHFLHEVYQEFNQRNEPIYISEIGAAYGLALHNFQQQIPNAVLTGTEWTGSFRRVAKNSYNIDLKVDFDFTKKYDLLMSYKVLEHQLDADLMLQKYVDCLKDDGYFYISVPCWFDTMYNFGKGGFDLEYYYDPNHINCWTLKQFKGLLHKAGLEIIKEDHIIYDSTFLCKKNLKLKETYKKEDYIEQFGFVMGKLKNIFEANLLFMENKYQDALTVYKNFPEAWMRLAEMQRDKLIKDDALLDSFIKDAYESCPRSSEIYSLDVDFLMRRGEYKDAIEVIEKGLKTKPENPLMYLQLINCLRELALKSKQKSDKQHYFKQAREVSSHLGKISAQYATNAIDYIYLFDSLIEV